MPLQTLWDLKLRWYKKAQLFVMFSVGSFVIVCSALRLPSLMKLGSSSDPSYDQAPIAVCTDLEVAVGIICACLPACHSLIGYLFPALKMSLGSSGPSLPVSAYPAKSVSHVRYGSKGRALTSTRSFIELDDRTRSEDALEDGTKAGRGYETPIEDQLNPEARDGYGSRAVAGFEVGGRQERLESPNTIILTRTLEQVVRRL